MARLDIDDKQIYYEYYPGDGLCNVLSHGFGMAGRVWDNTVARLADAGYAVLTYDHRACGQSDKDFRDVSIEALGQDLVALVEHLALPRVVLNGWSLGGAVVVSAAAELGDRVQGLISTAGATPRYTQGEGFPHGGTPDDVADTVAALRADRVNFLKGLYFEGVFAAPVSDDVKQWCWQLATQASPAADASLGALAELDQRTALAALKCPTLFICGGQDGVVPPDIVRFACKHARRGELVELADCGHAPFLEDPEAYHLAMFDFLERL